MNISEIKNGQAYTAKLGSHSFSGHVFISPNKDYIWFCTNNEYLDGDESPNLLGYKYSWVVTIKPDGTLNIKDLYSIKLLNGKDKIISIKDYKRLANYNFKILKTNVKFGCGEVTLPIASIKAFVKISNILKKRETVLTELDWEILNAQFS